MVVKQLYNGRTQSCWFESSVISYGSQTRMNELDAQRAFESSVISYGSQTFRSFIVDSDPFESSVISYGSQTATVKSCSER